MHLAAHDLTIQPSQVIALLQTLNVISSELVVVRVLVAVWMVNVYISVVVVNDNNAATVSNVVHVLRSVRLLLLLLLCLDVVEVVLIQ